MVLDGMPISIANVSKRMDEILFSLHPCSKRRLIPYSFFRCPTLSSQIPNRKIRYHPKRGMV